MGNEFEFELAWVDGSDGFSSVINLHYLQHRMEIIERRSISARRENHGNFFDVSFVESDLLWKLLP